MYLSPIFFLLQFILTDFSIFHFLCLLLITVSINLRDLSWDMQLETAIANKEAIYGKREGEIYFQSQDYCGFLWKINYFYF